MQLSNCNDKTLLALMLATVRADCTFRTLQNLCGYCFIRISKDLVKHLTIKICDKTLRNIARTSLSSENKIMKSSIYNEEINKLKKKKHCKLNKEFGPNGVALGV